MLTISGLAVLWLQSGPRTELTEGIYRINAKLSNF